MRRRTLGAVATLATSALLLAGCGGGGGSAPAGGGSGGGAALEGVGPITLVQGKDTSNFVQSVVDGWNKDHPDQKVRLIELPEDADAAAPADDPERADRSPTSTACSTSTSSGPRSSPPTARSSSCRRTSSRSTSSCRRSSTPRCTATSSTRVPNSSDGGLLYYRKDLLDAAGVTAPPKTWAEMADACTKVKAQNASINCYAGQFEKYEGLTVNFAEADQRRRRRDHRRLRASRTSTPPRPRPAWTSWSTRSRTARSPRRR